MARWQFPDASAENERLRAELEQAREEKNFWRQYAKRLLRDRNNAEDAQCRWREQLMIARAERDDLAARLQAIQQAERDLTRAKLDTAKAMRKGQAI